MHVGAPGLIVAAASREFVWTAVSGVAALICVAGASRSWRKGWEIDDTPTSTCRGVFVGRNEVVGRVVPTHQPMTTPFTSSPAVWFEWHLERYRSDDDGGSWVTVERRSTMAPFWVEDDTGRVLVRPRSAELEAQQTICERLGRGYDPPYSRWQLRQWVLAGEDAIERAQSLADASFLEPPQASRWFSSGTAEPLGALSGKNRVTERVLLAGQPVYLLGDARPRPEAPGLEFSSAAGPLLLTTRTEAEVAASSRSSARTTGLIGLVTSAVFAYLLSAIVTGDHSVAWPIAIVAVELVLLVGSVLIRNHNRQITVKEQAAKAWSMIDVSLRRRSDLLPNLAQVAEAYARHERSTQDALASLRADHALPAQEVLPGDATLVAAEASDRGQRRAAAQAFALAEGYPELRASSVFLDLQRRIVDAEEAVASARTFYNRAINVLRDRRQQFPGSLFARLVAVPSWRLFEAEEMALAAPPVAIAPVPADAGAGADHAPVQPEPLPPPPSTGSGHRPGSPF